MSPTTSAAWLRQLQHVACRQNSLRGLNHLVEVIGTAVGGTGAVLWEQAEPGNGTPRLSVLAQWPRAADAGVAARLRCDATTLAAFRTGTLALPPPDGPRTGRVIGALPISYLDGHRGVLSLTGDAELSAAAFDIAADLLDVLPELCSTLRDRQTLAMVRNCQRILHEADLEAPRDPLSRDRLSEYVAQVCRSVGAVLECADVAVYLRGHDTGDDVFPLFAGSPREHPERPDAVRLPPGWPAAGPGGPAGLPGGPAGLPGGAPNDVLACPVTSGDHLWGLIRCGGSCGPPFGFTRADEESLTTVAAQLAQYWSSWLHRRTISAENLSLHRLAAGITSFNQLISEELSRGTPRDRIIDDIALKIVLDVVPECTRVDIRQATHTSGGSGTALAYRAAKGPAGDLAETEAVLPEVVADLLLTMHLTRSQRSATADAGVVNPQGADHGPGWLVGTPIGFGGRSEGVLVAFGPSATLPPNSPQVCEIIGDQLALYHRLHQTMNNLQDTRRRLQETVRGQADTLADLEHQLVSPLLTATSRIERVIQSSRFDSRTDTQLRAVRGLCRKASRVAMSAGVFALLSKRQKPTPKEDLLGADDVLRILIACADDAQMLSNPRRCIAFDVDRDSVRGLGRRLIRGDRSFLEQCVGNLLDNAAKYSYESTAVGIGGRLGERAFAVSVTSSGLPMGPEDVQHCLERNWRGTAASATTGEGSGLGLWIVDNLMRSMRGGVHISADGDQTTVHLTFPI